MAEIITEKDQAKKSFKTEDELFDSLKLKSDGSEEELKQQEDTFFDTLKTEIITPSEDIPLETDNNIRKDLLQSGFNNAEINEYLGVTPEASNNRTDRIVRALGGSADYIARTLPETAGAVVTGSAAWFLSKGAGTIIGLSEGMANGGDFEKGMKEGKRIEELIANNLTLSPTDPDAKNIINTISHVIEWFTGPTKEVGKIAEDITAENPILKAVGFDKLAPWIKYVSEFGIELIAFKLAHVGGKKIGAKIEAGIDKVEGKLKPAEKVEVPAEEVGDFIIDSVLKDKSPEEALTDFDNIYPKLAEKKAKESAEIFEGEFKKLQHEKQIEAIKEITKETGKTAEASAMIFDSSESRLTELEVLIEDIKKLAPSEVGKRKGKAQIAAEVKPTEIPKDKLGEINNKINEILELKKVAEQATGSDLNSFYNKAINDILKDSPKEVKVEVQSVLKKEAMGKEVADEVSRLEIEKQKILTEIDIKSERVKQKGITAIEKEKLRQDIESGKSHAGFLGEEISRIETEVELKGISPLISKEGGKRFISPETYIQAKNRFAQKSKEFRTGIDPEMVKDLITIGAYHIETGFRNFKDWSALMIKQSGEKIRPHLQDIWEKSNTLYKDELINRAGEQIRTQEKQRKFLQTVKESATTEQNLREGVANIKPQEYIVQPNKESLSKAKGRIDKSVEEAEGYVLSDTALSAEKGATFISLIEKAQIEGNFNKAVELTEAYDMQLREAGRFAQTASIWNRLTPEGFVRWAQKEINKVNEKRGFTDKFFRKKKAELTKADKEFITQKMDKINKMKDGIDKTNATLEMIDFVASKAPPSISELIDAYRYQNMLSSWQTQERNLGENTFITFMTRPYDIAVEGMIDYVQSTLQGKQREAYVKDVAVYYKNAINALPNAVDAFRQVMKMNVESFGKPDLGVDFKSDFSKARAKQLPKYLTVVSRFMEASDRFNSTLISSGEYAVLRKRGIPHEEALAKSKLLGEKYLYRNKFDVTKNDLSYMSKVIVDLDKLLVESRHLPIIGKPMSWFIPFIRTPMNKAIAMIEHSPIGFARSFKSYNRETMAKAIGSTAITAIGAMYALDNKTTWVAPTDPDLKKLFYASGKRPFSILMGDKWVPVWYLGPFALAFALPAAAKYYNEDQKPALADNNFKKMIDIANGSARFLASQSSTQSIGAFFNFIAGDIDYQTPHQLGFMTEQIIPLSGLVRTVNKIFDPVYRKPDGYLESIMKDLPILSKDIAAHETILGEEAEREIFNAFIPYETGTMDTFYDSLYRDTLEIKQFEAKGRKESKKIEKEIKKKIRRQQ